MGGYVKVFTFFFFFFLKGKGSNSLYIFHLFLTTIPRWYSQPHFIDKELNLEVQQLTQISMDLGLCLLPVLLHNTNLWLKTTYTYALAVSMGSQLTAEIKLSAGTPFLLSLSRLLVEFVSSQLSDWGPVFLLTVIWGLLCSWRLPSFLTHGPLRPAGESVSDLLVSPLDALDADLKGPRRCSPFWLAQPAD